MYIDIVPNRNSPPAVLLRESYREGKKVLKRTIANLSEVPRNIVEGLRILLCGGAAVEHFEDSFEIERSLPHGHVAAVLGTLRKLKLDTLIDSEPSEERNRVMGMIVARILDPRSKLATARGLDEETCTSTLAEILEVQKTDAQALYTAMDWLGERQAAFGKRYAGALRRELHLLRGEVLSLGAIGSFPGREEGQVHPVPPRSITSM